MKNTLLWLDDFRNPDFWAEEYLPIREKLSDVNVVWVKDYEGFCKYIDTYGVPDEVCFDNDLGQDKEGYDCCKYLVDYCIEHDLDVPKWGIQSSNPVARENINSLMSNYHNFYIKDK